MSHRHSPPRQDRRNVGRAPVKAHAGTASIGARGRTSRPVTSATNANVTFNKIATRNGSSARKLTPGQIVATLKTN